MSRPSVGGGGRDGGGGCGGNGTGSDGLLHAVSVFVSANI